MASRRPGAVSANPLWSAILGLLLMLGGVPPARAAKWTPVSPADLALTASAAGPGADVEILLSEHQVDQTGTNIAVAGAPETGEEGMITQDFVRAKIFTAKGVEDQGKLSIEYPSNTQIRRPEARVVKPDGTSIELTKADFYESVVAKVAGEKWKKLTWAFPNLAAGDIVEYRWNTYSKGAYWYTWFYCQEKFPVREYRFTVGDLNYKSQILWMNCPSVEQSRKGGNFSVIVRNLPAFEEEENMPAQREFRGWIYMIRIVPGFSAEDTWKHLTGYWGEEFNLATKPGSLFKAKAGELTAGASTDEEKLRRLYDFCQSEITNYTWWRSPETQVAREKNAKEERQSPKRILERRAGRWQEVNYLFAALARGAGFDVRQGRGVSKAEILKVKTAYGWAFLDRESVAVKLGDQWRYFDPGSFFTPFGMLNWRDEDTTMLRCDEDKNLLFDHVAASASERTQVQRKGRFTLDGEGTLEGEVEERYDGHLAAARKAASADQSAEDVDKDFREELTKRLPNAEVSEIVWSNLRTRELPLIVKYRVRAPGYAEQAGKRIVLSPSFFEAGKPVVFAPAERKFPIFFPYARAEHDDIEIVLPEGYTLDKPSAPVPVGDPTKAFGATYQLKYAPKTRTFGYQRDFALGANGAIGFQVASYPVLKRLFEELHNSDTHSIMLKPKTAPVEAAAPAAPAAPPTAETSAAAPATAQP